MSSDISLHELLDLSIGTPDAGSVNFGALHTLLHALLGHLKIERITTTWKEVDHDHDSPAQNKALLLDSSRPYRALEEKLRRMEEQMCALEALPSAAELMRSDTALSDMWTLMQLRRKTQANEDGVSKCMALIQDLLKEIQELKESRDDLRLEVDALNNQLSQLNMNELLDRIMAMEQYCHQVEDLDNTTKELKDKMAQYPVPEELTQCVTWEVMQAALMSERQKIQEGLQDTLSATKNIAPVHPLNLGIPFKDDRAGAGGTAGVDLPRRVSPPQQSQSDGALCTVTGRRLSRVSIGAERYPETVEALMEVGGLRDRHESLEARVGQLEANKADQTQLQHLRDLLNAMEERQVPDHVPEQLNHLRTLVDSLLADKEKVSDVESVLMDTRTVQVCESSDSAGQSTGSASGQHTHSSQIEQLNLQTAHIRIAVLKLDEKVQELIREKTHDRAEERHSEDIHIQEQSNSLRAMMEDVRSSSSSLLSPSGQQEAVSFSKADGQDQAQSSGQGQGQQQTGGQGLDQEVSQLSQSHNKPEDKTILLTNQGHEDRNKSTDLVSDLEGAILQLQSKCEKLHRASNLLMEEHSQKQTHIDRLLKIVEELDEKKADKQVVEMEIEIKADKRALESKVSRMQFDSMSEQLNNMFQDLLRKIGGQEQDWNKVIEKISTEMDCKLNRTELDPLKKQLDDRWRTIHKHLQTPPIPEQDDAAGFRKQLVARFHCISCDRPVDMMTPGQHLVSLPSAPGLPSHKSSRPYTVYELEQVRQHCRRGSAQDEHSHVLICRQIDPEPSQYPKSRSPKLPNSQGLPEISRTHYRPNLGPAKRSSTRSMSKHERIPEMADYSYLSRNCGGSHTLTYPSHRYTRLQHITHLIQSEEESRPVSSGPPKQAAEVDILGLDGQVYKGRMSSRTVRLSETRFPTISPREGNWKSRDKVSRSQSQRSSGVDAGRGSPARPQSAKTHRSCSASSASMKDRPQSSMDCLSQNVPLQTSFHDTTTELKEALELHKELNQSEDGPVTSL
ncbi:glutamine-rich protein 2 isoform X2 [Carassius carassius]|uniref:glutamine-rich protein 2 isoform X2 n=1 Tax=Carassius carassius TaxID=217509 RepID=UPI00286875DC|nr:glutamine-rich protein 2 isoform X2 [Carassius carassius]